MKEKIVVIIFSIIIILGFMCSIVYWNNTIYSVPNYYDYNIMGEFSEKT